MCSNPRHLPPEMWLSIAAHLSPGEVSQLARLCRPFAVLAHERNEERINTLCLSTRASMVRGTQDMYCHESETGSVHDFVAKLKQTIASGRAPRIRKLLLHHGDLHMRDAPQHSGILRQLGQLFARTPDSRRDTQRLYKPLAIDSLALMFTPSSFVLESLYPPVIGATWSAFSANLRELAISADTAAVLRFCLSGVDPTFTLPRLEVMRLSYSRNHNRYPDLVTLQRLARIYSTRTLTTLELHLSLYPSLDPPLLQAIIPSAGAVTALKTFSLAALTCATSRVELMEVLLASIKPHLATLVHFGIDCSSVEFGSILDSKIAFRPDVALSLGGVSSRQFDQLSDAGNSGNTAHLRDSTLELNIGFLCQSVAVEWLVAFRNLCALSMTVRDFQLDYLVRLARAAPQLASLKILNTRLGEPFAPKDSSLSNQRPGICELFEQEVQTADKDVLNVLGEWRLRDLKISSHYQHKSACGQSRRFGLLMASVLPFVTSLNGRDLRDSPQSEPTDEVWIWNRNSILLKAAARRRGLFTGSMNVCLGNL